MRTKGDRTRKPGQIPRKGKLPPKGVREALIPDSLGALVTQFSVPFSLSKNAKTYDPFVLDGKTYQVVSGSRPVKHSFWISVLEHGGNPGALQRVQFFLANRHGVLVLAIREGVDLMSFHDLGWAVRLEWRVYELTGEPTTEPRVESLPLYSPCTGRDLARAVREWNRENAANEIQDPAFESEHPAMRMKTR